MSAILKRLHESEAYFGDPKSKLPDFHHSIELVSHFHSATLPCPHAGGHLPQGGHLCAQAAAGSHHQVKKLDFFDLLLICSRFNLVRSWTPYIMFYYIPTATFTFYGD